MRNPSFSTDGEVQSLDRLDRECLKSVGLPVPIARGTWYLPRHRVSISRTRIRRRMILACLPNHPNHPHFPLHPRPPDLCAIEAMLWRPIIPQRRPDTRPTELSCRFAVSNIFSPSLALFQESPNRHSIIFYSPAFISIL